MGRCGSCRTQTQHFCFVHQEFVCDACLTSKGNIHGRCVVSTYRKWVQDSSYEWPPKCPACNIELEAEGDNIRRNCLHVEHAACVEKSVPPDHACAACKAPLQKSFDGTPLGEATIQRLRLMPALRAVLPQPPKREEPETPQTSVRVPSAEPLEPQFQRPNATLRVVETDIGTSTSHVATDEDRDRRRRPAQPNAPPEPHLSSVQITPQEAPVQKPLETRLEMGLPPLKSKSGKNGPLNKREKGSARIVSASWRRTLKAGSRRLVDIRKLLRENRSRFVVALLFLACIIVVTYLSSGDEEATAASHSVVEDVTLPHVRVNPAFLRPEDSDIARIRERIG